MHARCLRLLLVLLFVPLAPGCGGGGPSTTPVSGTVKFADGTPLSQGAVTFTNAQHTAFAEIKPDGTYAMGTSETGDGVPPGTYQVSVTVGSGYGEEAEAAPALDPKFQNPSTSGLTFEVPDSGPATYDITVEKAQ